MMMESLRDCPCGYPARWLRIEQVNYADPGEPEDPGHHVECGGCRRRGRIRALPEEAVAAWNRHAEDVARAEAK